MIVSPYELQEVITDNILKLIWTYEDEILRLRTEIEKLKEEKKFLLTIVDNQGKNLRLNGIKEAL